MLPRGIDNLAAKLEKRLIMLLSNVVKNIQALCYWAQERRRQALPLDPNAFDEHALNNAIDDMNKRVAKQTDSQPTIKPGKFNQADWNTWYKQFLTYLSHIITRTNLSRNSSVASLKPSVIWTTPKTPSPRTKKSRPSC